MNNLNKNDQGFITGIHHERKNVEPGSMADLFLAELERWADPPRTLRERRTTPPNPDSDPQEPDPPRIDPLTDP